MVEPSRGGPNPGSRAKRGAGQARADPPASGIDASVAGGDAAGRRRLLWPWPPVEEPVAQSKPDAPGSADAGRTTVGTTPARGSMVASGVLIATMSDGSATSLATDKDCQWYVLRPPPQGPRPAPTQTRVSLLLSFRGRRWLRRPRAQSHLL